VLAISVGRAHDFVDAPFAHRPVDGAGLTETATLGTSALDLDHGAVVYHIQVGHDGAHWRRRQWIDQPAQHARRRGRVRRFRSGQDPVGVVARGIQRGDVDAGYGGGADQKIAPLSAAPGTIGVDQLNQRLFAIADHDQIQEIGHRLRVEGAAAAGDHQRRVVAALGGQHGQAGQIEHIEHVGQVQFISEREAHDVESGEGPARFQAVERQPASA